MTQQVFFTECQTHVRKQIRRVQLKIDHIGSVGGNISYNSMGGTQWCCASAEKTKRHSGGFNITDNNSSHSLSGCSPFIHDDRVPGSGFRLRRWRDKAGLDEKLLLRPSFGKNLEVDNLASLIDIRRRDAGPGHCGTIRYSYLKQPNTVDLHYNLPSIAFMSKVLPFPGPTGGLGMFGFV